MVRHAVPVRPPLLLTGGPAAGKSATSRQLAATLQCAAVINVDDIRHLVVAGHAAPWDGDEGRRQQRIGIENACDLARRFTSASIDVVLSDVLNRRLLPHVVVVRLSIPLAKARRRATLRPVHLTGDEFERLHAFEAGNELAVDATVEVGNLSLDEQVHAVRQLWAAGA